MFVWSNKGLQYVTSRRANKVMILTAGYADNNIDKDKHWL